MEMTLAFCRRALGTGWRLAKAWRVDDVRDWRLHLGAHKTATTHLQDTLAQCRERLAAEGVAYIPRPLIRDAQIPDWRRRRGGLTRRAEIILKTAPHRGAHPCVVMSEENWLGPPQDALAPVLYPEAAAQIGALAALGGRGRRLTFFLAIRSWDAFLPAAYATALRFVHFPDGFEPIRRRVLVRPPSWVELVERLGAVAPRAAFRVWEYESYRARSREIAAALCGRDIGPPPTVPDPISTRTPPAEAVAAAERVDPALPWWERKACLTALYADAIGRGGGKYMPFLPEERGLLREAYEEQRAALRRRVEIL